MSEYRRVIRYGIINHNGADFMEGDYIKVTLKDGQECEGVLSDARINVILIEDGDGRYHFFAYEAIKKIEKGD